MFSAEQFSSPDARETKLGIWFMVGIGASRTGPRDEHGAECAREVLSHPHVILDMAQEGDPKPPG